tara:strand:+ start:603 stop:1481 length:879 start_codon:yes stop_codon:yes gene_type:complete
MRKLITLSFSLYGIIITNSFGNKTLAESLPSGTQWVYQDVPSITWTQDTNAPSSPTNGGILNEDYDCGDGKITGSSVDTALNRLCLSRMIKESEGVISIGENSLKLKETTTEQQMWGTNSSGNSVPINIINGSKLLINGRDIEQSINNVGALSAALTGLPTVPKDTTLACGLGSGSHGGGFAFSGGCASKVNEKLSINYAASMTMPGQDYAGDFEDQFSTRTGFVWKLGKSNKPTQISMKAKEKMEGIIYSLKENNKKIISQNKSLLARLERLEKIALDSSKLNDLATTKLP